MGKKTIFTTRYAWDTKRDLRFAPTEVI